MSFEKTKMEVTGMKLKELLKKIDNREMLNIYNKEKDCIGRMEPENARKYLSILLLESEVDVIRRRN